MFAKFTYEQVYRYFQFKRPDGNDGLAAGETLVSITSVICIGKDDSVDYTVGMIASPTIVNNTEIQYTLKGGTSGKSYYIYFQAVTSAGQNLEGMAEIYVK